MISLIYNALTWHDASYFCVHFDVNIIDMQHFSANFKETLNLKACEINSHPNSQPINNGGGFLKNILIWI